MDSELIISDDGRIVYLRNAPLVDVVLRAEYYPDNGSLVFIFETKGQYIAGHITEDATRSSIIQSSSILISAVTNGTIQDGYEVPLITVG